jgi:hypothetical protein
MIPIITSCLGLPLFGDCVSPVIQKDIIVSILLAVFFDNAVGTAISPDKFYKIE